MGERGLTNVKHSQARARRQQTAERLIYALAKAKLDAERPAAAQPIVPNVSAEQYREDREGRA